MNWLLTQGLAGGDQGGEQGGMRGGAAAADEKLSGSLALLGGQLGAAGGGGGGGGGGGVGWVSTELHLRMASSSLLGGEVTRTRTRTRIRTLTRTRTLTGTYSVAGRCAKP